MFVEISKANLSDTEKTGIILIRGWSAVDTENMAYLSRTAGHTRFGLPKYILILPVPKPARFGELLEAYKRVDFVRSVIRAWSLDEAIYIANKRMPKLLDKRNLTQRRADLLKAAEEAARDCEAIKR